MSEIKRVVCLVADGFGVGEAPDASHYGDVGSNTLANTAAHVGGLRLPCLQKLGLGNIGHFSGIPRESAPLGYCGRLAERSAGKDTTTGHWELSGLVTLKAQAVFPKGFPENLLEAFIKEADLPGILANYPASGTAILDEWGEEHIRTGKPIVYTSADSVFQIAAHEADDIFGLKRLYHVCEVARRLTEPYQIGRVIARPFLGMKKGEFKRTEHRRDYSLAPDRNCLDVLHEGGISVYSVGKIDDIFCNRGITRGNHTGNNADSLKATLDFMKKSRGENAFIFTNLVDFDMLYGHRRDPKGYAQALVDLDNFLPNFFKEMEPGDLLMLTSDHGCDPTFRGTDHTREYVPLVAYSPEARGGSLGDRKSFADVAATILEAFELPATNLPGVGQSILCKLKN